MLTKIEDMRSSAQYNHIPLELQQILEDCFAFFFKLDSLICYQPLHCISLTPFLIFSLPLCCADWALLCSTHDASRATLIINIDYGGCQRESQCSINPEIRQREEKESEAGKNLTKIQWLLVASQSSLMPTVLKWGYFFMLKPVLPQISLDRMNDREWQKISYNFESSHKLSARS